MQTEATYLHMRV